MDGAAERSANLSPDKGLRDGAGENGPLSQKDDFGASPHLPTIAKQAAAVERAAVNWRGHVNNLRDLAARGKRPQLEYDMAAAWLPDLEAAAATIRRLASA